MIKGALNNPCPYYSLQLSHLTQNSGAAQPAPATSKENLISALSLSLVLMDHKPKTPDEPELFTDDVSKLHVCPDCASLTNVCRAGLLMKNCTNIKIHKWIT